MEKMKLGMLIFATCAASAVAGFALGYFVYGEEQVITKTHAEARIAVPFGYYAEPPEKPAPPSPEPEYKFVVTSRDGAIVVYYAGEETEFYDVAIDGLPDADRERLEQGIFAYTEEELARILEDYGS